VFERLIFDWTNSWWRDQ